MSGEPKPCPTPWCGSGPARPMTSTLAGFSGVEINGLTKPFVWCGTCGVCGPACDTEADAITAWNTRTDTNSDLLEASGKVLAWWDGKIANELSSNSAFPWAEDAEWSEFHALRTAIAKYRALIEEQGL